MKPSEIFLILGALGLFFVTEAQNRPDMQEWGLQRSNHPGKVKLSLDVRKTKGLSRNRWQQTQDVEWAMFSGMKSEELDRMVHALKFDIVHDAGTMHCTGRTGLGRASGTFTFEPNHAFADKLRDMGYASPTDDQLFSMLMHNVTLEFARKSVEAGLRASTQELIRMRSHGVSDDYIDKTRASGYPDITARSLIQFRDHGVTTEFLRDLQASGYTLSPSEVVELRDHGVSSDFIAAVRAAGYKDIAASEIRDLRDRGVDEGYLRALRDHGLNPPPRDLIQMRDHGVDPEFLRALKDAGYGDLSTGDVVQLRDHGVPAKFIHEVREHGFNFSPKEIVAMRDHGVDGAYLRKLKESGYGNLTSEKIIKLRDHGVD